MNKDDEAYWCIVEEIQSSAFQLSNSCCMKLGGPEYHINIYKGHRKSNYNRLSPGCIRNPLILIMASLSKPTIASRSGMNL